MQELPAPPQEWCDINYVGIVSYLTPAMGCYPKPYYRPMIGAQNPLALLEEYNPMAPKYDATQYLPMSGIDAPTYINPPSNDTAPLNDNALPSVPKLDAPTQSGGDINKDCSINIPGCSKTIGQIAKEYNITNVPDSLVAAIQEQESHRNPNVGCNYAGACGIGQIVGRIWNKKYGTSNESLKNPCINTSVTIRIMSDAIRRYNNIPTAVHSYYGFGTPAIGPSGADYTRQVLNRQAKYECESSDDTNGSKSFGPLGAYCPISPKGIS